MSYRIAIYELDQAYGGPEEGGWWYDTGDRKLTINREFADRESAGKACFRLNCWLDRLQKGHRPVSSVAYGGGRFGAKVYFGDPPGHFPEMRPRYE